MPKYRCKVSSTNGLIGTVLDLPENNRTKELVRLGIVEPHQPKETKGGKTVQDADKKAEAKDKPRQEQKDKE